MPTRTPRTPRRYICHVVEPVSHAPYVVVWLHTQVGARHGSHLAALPHPQPPFPRPATHRRPRTGRTVRASRSCGARTRGEGCCGGCWAAPDRRRRRWCCGPLPPGWWAPTVQGARMPHHMRARTRVTGRQAHSTGPPCARAPGAAQAARELPRQPRCPAHPALRRGAVGGVAWRGAAAERAAVAENQVGVRARGMKCMPVPMQRVCGRLFLPALTSVCSFCSLKRLPLPLHRVRPAAGCRAQSS